MPERIRKRSIESTEFREDYRAFSIIAAVFCVSGNDYWLTVSIPSNNVEFNEKFEKNSPHRKSKILHPVTVSTDVHACFYVKNNFFILLL